MPNFGETRFDPNDKFEQQAWDGTNWISTSEFAKKFKNGVTLHNGSQLPQSPKFGETRFDPNDKFEQQAWDGTSWISTSDFRKKYNQSTSNSSITDKQFNRSYNTGDYAITGQSSNGINVTKDGNIFQYTGNNKEFLQNLVKAGSNLALNPNDPNNVGSFIGMFVTGDTDVKLGSTNQQTLNKNIEQPKEVVTAEKKLTENPGRSIIIGDSQTPLIQKNSKKLEPVLAEGTLWKVGWALNNLNSYIQNLQPDTGQKGFFVTNVFICIGTNGAYTQYKIKDGPNKGKELIPVFIENVKKAFPKAKLYVIKGSTGWGGLVNIADIDAKLNKFYERFAKEGVTVLENGIGKTDTHPTQKTPGIIAVAKEIDTIIGGSSLPTSETVTPPPKKEVKKAEAIVGGTEGIEVTEADILQEEYNNLPSEEGTQLFEVIAVTDTSVINIDFENFEIYKQYFQTKINNADIKYSKNKGNRNVGTGGPVSAAADNYKMDGERVASEQCEVYYGDNTPYIAQLNNWGCLVTSISMMAPACGVNITQTMFYGSDLIRKKPYILSTNDLNLPLLQKDYPQIKRTTDGSGKLSRAQIFEKYKNDIRKYKKPIIIRMKGCGIPSRGHYVVAVGITKDGNIIIHNPARRAIAFKDQVIGSNVLLGSDQPSNNGKDYDVLYIQ